MVIYRVNKRAKQKRADTVLIPVKYEFAETLPDIVEYLRLLSLLEFRSGRIRLVE